VGKKTTDLNGGLSGSFAKGGFELVEVKIGAKWKKRSIYQTQGKSGHEEKPEGRKGGYKEQLLGSIRNPREGYLEDSRGINNKKGMDAGEA